MHRTRICTALYNLLIACSIDKFQFHESFSWRSLCALELTALNSIYILYIVSEFRKYNKIERNVHKQRKLLIHSNFLTYLDFVYVDFRTLHAELT